MTYPGNVTLQEGADYAATITDSNNQTVDVVKTPGVYTLTITGVGSYTGTKTSTIIVYGYKETLGGYEFSTTGDEEGLYYLVDSEAALRAVSTYVNSGNNTYGKRFKQTQNISMTGGDFRPIGEYSVFNGTYDGGNFHISNLTVAKEYGYLGLFGLIGNADCGTTVKNVVLVSPTIATMKPNDIRSSSVAALIAVAMQDCTVDNCIVINPTFSIAGTNTNVGVGVIAKRLGSNNSITNCCFYDSNADNNYPAIYENYGNAVANVERVYKITATDCTATATPTVTIDGTDYYKSGTAVTVTADVPSSGMKKFTATGAEASLTDTLGQYTLTMPANDVTVSLADFTPTVTVAEATYSGEPLTPAITVKDGETPLTADTDYASVSYANNTNAGNSASVSITGQGWYLGSASQTFSISKAAAPVSLQDAQKPAAISDLTYTGEAQALVTAPTTAPEGYTVQYSADGGTTWSESVPTGTNAGEYAVKVRYQGDGNHTDFDSDDISVSVGKASITPVGITLL